MDLLNKFRAYIQKKNLFLQKDRLLIATSGGADSSVLCALCAACGYDFSLAHCNFKLRGAESNRDENFVREMAEHFRVKYFIKKFDTASEAKQNKTSVEETARNLRYAWFEELISQSGIAGEGPFKYLLTAHHADDNVETVMMNFFRGTGIKGLRGILPKQGNIIRPLLFAERKEIETFAADNNIAFVTDSSNAENNFTRNYFRNKLIPSVEKVFPQASQNIGRNIDRFTEAEYLYEESIGLLKKKLIEKKGPEINIPVLKLANSVPLNTIIYEIIKDYGFTAAQVPEVEKLLSSESGKYITSATHRILKNRNRLIIDTGNRGADNAHYIIEESTEKVLFGGRELNISRTDKPPKLNKSNEIACFDATALKYPLVLRRWKTGDYFYPLGMQKKKKISRFFADIKLSLSQKEKIWILESDKKILWVVGCRIDDRFKITAKTKDILKLHLTPAAP